MPPASSLKDDERLDFMERHYHLQVKYRGERLACLTFRKVANWYCRVLKPGRDVQQTLIRIESVEVFDRLVDGLRQRREFTEDGPWTGADYAVRVPSGPNERW